jgi:FOG: FHA domain
MDFLERLNRKFGSWYEGLFGAGSERDLRPRDILRRILAAMEDNRREGLDGSVYVPNDYTLVLAIASEEERDYLRAFLDADDLTAAVRRAMEQYGYRTKGGLRFTIEEAEPTGDEARVQVRCRFDSSVPETAAAPAAPRSPRPKAATPAPPPAQSVVAAEDEDSEPGTVPAFGGAILATLLMRSGDGRVLEAFPLTAQGVRIGRSRQAGNDIVLAEDAMVSKRHARIVSENGTFVVVDEGSTNGTFVNSEAIPPRQPYALAFGDELRLGETTIVLKPVNAAVAGVAPLPARSHAPAVAAAAATAAVPPVVPSRAGAAGIGGGYRLVGDGGQMFPLASQMTVGRGVTSDIVLSAEGVSSAHARLSQRDDTLYVEDLNTPAGTYVNGERIPALFPVALYEGDEVGFGEARLRVGRGNGSGKQPPRP